MSTRPRIPSPIRPTRCSRWSRDVEDYPKFLPLCEALNVKRREQRDGKEVLVATMTVGYGMIHESFTTRCISTAPPAPSWSNISTGRSPSSKIAGTFSPTGASATARSRSISPMLPLAAVRAAGGRALRQGGANYTRAFEARADAVYGRQTAASRLTAMSRSSCKRALDAAPPDLGRARDRRTAPFRARSARRAAPAAKCTRPTGFSGVPPSGPAMPVTATARLACEWVSAPPAMARATSSLTAPCRSISQ